MIKKNDIELLVKETLVGLGSGIIGIYLFSFVNPWDDLFYSILFVIIAGYIFMWTGILVVGYLELKKRNQQNEFFKFFAFSFLGLITGVVFYGILGSLINKFIPDVFSSFILPVLLPIIGTIIGFNYHLSK